jgi:hypothetical protein
MTAWKWIAIFVAGVAVGLWIPLPDGRRTPAPDHQERSQVTDQVAVRPAVVTPARIVLTRTGSGESVRVECPEVRCPEVQQTITRIEERVIRVPEGGGTEGPGLVVGAGWGWPDRPVVAVGVRRLVGPFGVLALYLPRALHDPRPHWIGGVVLMELR